MVGRQRQGLSELGCVYHMGRRYSFTDWMQVASTWSVVTVATMGIYLATQFSLTGKGDDG